MVQMKLDEGHNHHWHKGFARPDLALNTEVECGSNNHRSVLLPLLSRMLGKYLKWQKINIADNKGGS